VESLCDADFMGFGGLCGLVGQLFVFFKVTLHETSFYKGNFFDHGY
jgi:hypothetical protein